MILKYWAKQRQINSAPSGVMNSYAHVLMLLWFLQNRRVVPPLQRLCCTENISDGIMFSERGNETDMCRKCLFCNNELPSRRVEEYEAYFYEKGKFPTMRNNEAISKLLMDFFAYFAFNFDENEFIISPRLGQLIRRSEHARWGAESYDRPLCIEDPFILERNCADSLDTYAFRGLKWEWRRAWRILSGRDGTPADSLSLRIDRLLHPYIPWHPIHFNELNVYR